jgi:hypothetical protein
MSDSLWRKIYFSTITTDNVIDRFKKVKNGEGKLKNVSESSHKLFVHLPLFIIYMYFLWEYMLCLLPPDATDDACNLSSISLIFVKNKEVNLAHHLNCMPCIY